MLSRSFLKAGHTPTLASAFLYFDLSFMVWVILGPLGVAIAKSFHLDPVQKGLMVAVPVLSGAALRLVAGVAVDHIGPKRAGIIGQLIVLAGLSLAWFLGIHDYSQVLLLGVLLGVAGASFAVALPLASRWYPPKEQGLALGIAGAGNSGTALAALFAPSLAQAYGWTNVIGLAALPLSVAFVVYLIFAKDAPNRPPPKTLAGDYLDGAEGPRRLVADAALRRHLRRLRRPQLVPDHLFQRRVPPEPRGGRLLHRRLRVRRLAGAADRRRAGRPRRRRENPDGGLRPGRGSAWLWRAFSNPAPTWRWRSSCSR